MASALRLRVEEIAGSDKAASNQAAALSTLIALARGFTLPLADNAANNGLKELLKTAEVTVQKRDRVVITATLSRSLFSTPAAGENSSPPTSASPGIPQ
jgi:hypothetical protein